MADDSVGICRHLQISGKDSNKQRSRAPTSVPAGLRDEQASSAPELCNTGGIDRKTFVRQRSRNNRLEELRANKVDYPRDEKCAGHHLGAGGQSRHSSYCRRQANEPPGFCSDPYGRVNCDDVLS